MRSTGEAVAQLSPRQPSEQVQVPSEQKLRAGEQGAARLSTAQRSTARQRAP